MARAGLGDQWTCLYANDIDQMKGEVYVSNWGNSDFHLGDIAKVKGADLNREADLLWASFPCQDLSLAGSGSGLEGDRSSTVSHVWRLIKDLTALKRRPKIIAFENVCGLISSRNGEDFRILTRSFDQAGYWVGAFVLDAKQFVPQSRKRVFFIGLDKSLNIDPSFVSDRPDDLYSPKNLQSSVAELPKNLRDNWIWWNIPTPVTRSTSLADILEKDMNVRWDDPSRTEKLLAQMTDLNRQKVRKASATSERVVGTVFRRTRIESGVRKVRAEVRFDGIAGCLRTPNGGSSKQTVILVEKNKIKTRHLTGRECARLMGISESYKLPENTNAALYLSGDGVVVPVVEHISQNLIEPILRSNQHLIRERNRPALSTFATCAA